MPVYAYKCRDCSTPLEVHQDFNDAPLTDCPACGGTLRKQYGSVGVTFNGSGFYRTDSRASTAKPGTGSGNGSSGGKSDGGSKESAAKKDTPAKTTAPAVASPSAS
jgi:putative FmdB family regulatory protein